MEDLTSKADKSDKKLERLLNLVLALLGTDKYLTKSQITSSIPGYEGLAETRDRMFERDKDDLRRIGIEIDVRNVDPLFEDEVGYRIDRTAYGIEIPSLTAEEGLICFAAISLADQHLTSGGSKSLWMKIDSLVTEGESTLDALMSDRSSDDSFLPTALEEVTVALKSKKVIKFEYTRELDGQTDSRTVEPRRLRRTDQGWLLTAWDQDRKDSRNFLVDNIGNVQLLDQDFNEVIPGDQGSENGYLTEVLVRVDRRLEESIRNESGRVIDSSNDHLVCSFLAYNIEALLRALIAIDASIEIITPDDVKETHHRLLTRMTDACR